MLRQRMLRKQRMTGSVLTTNLKKPEAAVLKIITGCFKSIIKQTGMMRNHSGYSTT